MDETPLAGAKTVPEACEVVTTAGGGAAIIPAWRAARLNILEAIHYE